MAGVGLNVVGGALERAASGSLRVEGADELTLFLAAATGYTAYDLALVDDPVMLRRICRGVLLRLHSEPYPLLRARHAEEHKALFDRCWLHLGRTGAIKAPTDERLQAMRDGSADDGLFALLFHYGRYLLMSSSRPGSQPANLQGIWNDLVRPPWSCNWTTNINTQMNYWPAETTNLAECHEPLMALITDLSRAGVSTAQDFYGCRGWAAHHNVDLWRSTWPVGNGGMHPYWVNWQMGGAWLCRHLWEHYAFSRGPRVPRAGLPGHARGGRLPAGLFGGAASMGTWSLARRPPRRTVSLPPRATRRRLVRHLPWMSG